MQRVITKKVDAILTADWHLREDIPVCRTDDYIAAQWRKVDFISALQRQYGCPVWHAGDLFDYWKPSPELLSLASLHIPDYFFTVYGNHDLPQHNIELVRKCGSYNLNINKRVSILQNGHWKDSLSDGRTGFIINGKHIVIQHVMTYQGVKPFPGCTDASAAKLLRMYPQYDLIVTGDNHKPFVEEYKGRLLVNPGSIMRMGADQIDHRPRVYLYHAEDNTVTPVFLPIDADAVSREHLDKEQERTGRIDAFIEMLDDDFTASVSFEENIERMAKKSKVSTDVMDIVYRAME